MTFRVAIALLILPGLLLNGTTTPASAQAVTPGAPNAALRYWQAFALMRDPASDKATTDLLESVAAGKEAWDEARLGPILDANAEALQMLQRGSQLRACEWGIDYELGPAAPIAHLAKARVLGRLNALEGMRLAANGQSSKALATWLAGITFARHIAQGGSLISLLSARPVLISNLAAVGAAVRRNQVGEIERKQIISTLEAIPESGFDWGAAMLREQAAVEVAVQQLTRSSDVPSSYRMMMGQAAPDAFRLPTNSDMSAFRAWTALAVDALRLPPGATGQRLDAIEGSKHMLNPFLAGLIPSLARINATRTELKSQRDEALRLAAAR